ncbi:TetR/AcrR family transcriptional regulator [Mammaliicoccus sciuri]|uniref:TetR/AcrR family transcriptional regulator n=1 Tax=Mammaliicoccus sciuri TaxID=1296 RepID=UPI001E3770FA|nr:TetR/AcrR family transcriptional regulator [Mammaliicoccus sciuri]MCD8819200.1 TetR/AcrR family transcriptional regulator [Mammaliicoccus sciuri]MCD8824203.1 TetR/AcrR family transcriptional regulator [Mammaliicoccus sciuri]MEB6288174.1 TetR/AcrR family transcriptional regulator [Mammaliicoccus sciuri]
MDRRVLKSQKAIKEALLELMQYTQFEKITINSIADKANVSRGTIYLNFIDKYHILEKCIDDEMKKLIDICMPINDGNTFIDLQETLINTLNYIENNSTLFIMFLKDKEKEIFKKQLLLNIKGSVITRIKLSNKVNYKNEDIYINFWAIAITDIIIWWIENSMIYSSKEISEQLLLILSKNKLIDPILDGK